MFVPIYPGSSSFTTGSTPFGFYDLDPHFQSEADPLAKWIVSRLGYPIVNIELQDINLYACFEEAVCEYSNQVNQFNIKEYMLTLQGASTGSSFTQTQVVPTFARQIELSEMYGSEAGVGGYVTWKTGSIDCVSGHSVYDLNSLWSSVSESGQAIEIKRIFHDTPPASLRFIDPTFNGAGASAFGAGGILDSFGFEGMGVAGGNYMMMPMYMDLLRMQAIEMSDQFRRSAYSFELINNQLRVFPIPSYDFRLWFHYIVKSERANSLNGPSGSQGNVISDVSNIPYTRIKYQYINTVGRQWIYKYALACAKETLGVIRGKYTTQPLPGTDLSLDGSMTAQGASEKQALITEIQAVLDQTSRQNMMKREEETALSLQNQMKNVPLKIWIA